MKSITEVEVIASAGKTSIGHIVIILHHIVISKLCDGEQALEASIHVAVESVVLESHNPVFKVRKATVHTNHRVWLWIVFSSIVPPPTSCALHSRLLLDDGFFDHAPVRQLYLLPLVCLDQGGATPVQRHEEVEQVLVHVVELLARLFLSLIHRGQFRH